MRCISHFISFLRAQGNRETGKWEMTPSRENERKDTERERDFLFIYTLSFPRFRLLPIPHFPVSRFPCALRKEIKAGNGNFERRMKPQGGQVYVPDGTNDRETLNYERMNYSTSPSYLQRNVSMVVRSYQGPTQAYRMRRSSGVTVKVPTRRPERAAGVPPASARRR